MRHRRLRRHPRGSTRRPPTSPPRWPPAPPASPRWAGRRVGASPAAALRAAVGGTKVIGCESKCCPRACNRATNEGEYYAPHATWKFGFTIIHALLSPLWSSPWSRARQGSGGSQRRGPWGGSGRGDPSGEVRTVVSPASGQASGVLAVVRVSQRKRMGSRAGGRIWLRVLVSKSERFRQTLHTHKFPESYGACCTQAPGC